MPRPAHNVQLHIFWPPRRGAGLTLLCSMLTFVLTALPTAWPLLLIAGYR